MKPYLMILCAALLVFSAAAADPAPAWTWKGKGDAKTLEKTGIYVWAVPGLTLLPGEYRVVGRLRSQKPGTFTLQAVENFTGKQRFRGSVKTGTEYADLDFGTLQYDGDWPVRIVDWNEPGFHIESISLIPVKLEPQTEERGNAADTLDGWIPMYHTRLSVDPKEKKSGNASLLVSVAEKKGVPWYDVGVMRRLNADKAGMISFWLRFDGRPKPVWVQLIGGKESACTRFKPEEFGIVPGEWKLVELPVSSFRFKPERNAATDIRGIAICPETGGEACAFRIDDPLLE